MEYPGIDRAQDTELVMRVEIVVVESNKHIHRDTRVERVILPVCNNASLIRERVQSGLYPPAN